MEIEELVIGLRRKLWGLKNEVVGDRGFGGRRDSERGWRPRRKLWRKKDLF